MTDAADNLFQTGSEGLYQWLTTGKHDLDSFLSACPRVVLGKYLAITSFDSGSLSLNESEIASGWSSREGIAYSPPAQTIEQLPRGGWDEWYIFSAPRDLGCLFDGNVFMHAVGLGQVAAFVNYGAFGFHLPEYRNLTDIFWKQMEGIQPESFVADGNLLNFVTRDQELFAAVCSVLR